MSAALAKVAKSLVTSFLKSNKEDKSKTLKVLLISIIFVVFSIPILISVPGILLKGLDIESFDIGNYSFSEEELNRNPNYIKVRDTYIKYLEDIDLKIDNKVEQIKKDYTYEVEIVTEDEEGNSITYTETRIPEVIKDVRIEKPELRHILAYLGIKYMDIQTDSFNSNSFSYDKKEITNFISNIMVYKEEITGSDPITLKIRFEVLELESIAAMNFTYSEYKESYKDKRDMFILSYHSMEDYVDALADGIYKYIDISTLNISEKGMEIPLMLQYDAMWGNASYGTTTIKKGGCAILCMSMVQAYLKGVVPNPISIAQWSAQKNYYYSGVGTSWDFFKAYSDTIDIVTNNLGKNTSEVVKALESGKPVIASMKPGTFTSSGHFIVLRGITKEGKIFVNDPNDNLYTKNHFDREFSYSLIYSEAKNFWSFE